MAIDPSLRDVQPFEVEADEFNPDKFPSWLEDLTDSKLYDSITSTDLSQDMFGEQPALTFSNGSNDENCNSYFPRG